MSKTIDLGLSGTQHVPTNKDRKDPMWGAIAGDIIGSRFEFDNHKDKKFDLFTDKCEFTDDTVMTLAVYRATKDYCSHGKSDENCHKKYLVNYMSLLGRCYPNLSYGTRFYRWLFKEHNPYGSFGNGAPMRISGIYAVPEAGSFEVVTSTIVSHNHAESIKAVLCLYDLIDAAYRNNSKENLKVISGTYYNLDFTLDAIRPLYKFDETCQGTMPVAIQAFLESNSFEDAIRNAISIGGDSDTIAAITGSIAGAYYGVPKWIKDKVLEYLDDTLKEILLN